VVAAEHEDMLGNKVSCSEKICLHRWQFGGSISVVQLISGVNASQVMVATALLPFRPLVTSGLDFLHGIFFSV